MVWNRGCFLEKEHHTSILQHTLTMQKTASLDAATAGPWRLYRQASGASNSLAGTEHILRRLKMSLVSCGIISTHGAASTYSFYNRTFHDSRAVAPLQAGEWSLKLPGRHSTPVRASLLSASA